MGKDCRCNACHSQIAIDNQEEFDDTCGNCGSPDIEIIWTMFSVESWEIINWLDKQDIKYTPDQLETFGNKINKFLDETLSISINEIWEASE